MTGENFTRLNRHDEHLEKMLRDLSSLREKWSVAYHDTDCNDYLNVIYKIENKIEKLKNCIYTYVHKRSNGNYSYIRDFERKYLW